MRLNPVLIGIILILAGFLLVFLGSLASDNTESGGVVFIGPIPIVFGSRKLWLPALIVGGIVLVVFYLLRP